MLSSITKLNFFGGKKEKPEGKEQKDTNQYFVVLKATGLYWRTDYRSEDLDLQSSPVEQTNPGEKLNE